MRTIERPMGSDHPRQDAATGILFADLLRRASVHVRNELAARFGPIEWVLLATIVVLPIALMWHFASASYFVADDLVDFYRVRHRGALLPFVFEPSFGHLAPAHRLAYVGLDGAAPMNFGVALGGLLAFQAVSALLLQRILNLLFGRAWWTYALPLAWAISAIYLPPFAWFAAGLHSIPAITATLASIHGYLCWRVSGRRAWVVWSLVAMGVGLAFYLKALLIPLYLVLMRLLLLDPAARVRDSLRSLRFEWRVWLAYAAVCALYLLVFFLGDYSKPEGGVEMGEVLRYLRIFWVEGFWPAVFGMRVPGGEDSQRFVVVGVQVVLVGLVAWSVVRRRVAWRAWAFLLAAIAANALVLIQRVSEWGAETVGHRIPYFTEPALLVPLAIPFAFAVPHLRERAGPPTRAVPAVVPPARNNGFRAPTMRAGAIALVALVAYVGLTWVTASKLADEAGAPESSPELRSGRDARTYFDNLRGDLAAVRQAGARPSLLDHDVPETVITQLNNLEGRGVRYTLLSSVVPLFDDRVTFNQPGHLHIVGSDGHLRRTRFVPAAGGSPAKLRHRGRLAMTEAHVQRPRGEWCVVADGLSALEWEPRSPLRGRDWWLRGRYRTDPVQPFWLQTNAGAGWIDQVDKLPAMGFAGTGFVNLSEASDGAPTNAGVRLKIPDSGRLCLRSLEIGYFDPPPPPPE